MSAANRICSRKDVGNGCVSAGFREIERESVDILAVGPSYVYCTFNLIELYRATGLRSQVLGSSGQPIEATFHYLKMALGRCRPKAVVIGTSMFVSGSAEKAIGDEGAAHFAADPIPLGLEKLEMLQDMRLAGDMEGYLFPFVKYHQRWKSLMAHDFGFGDIPNVPYSVHCGYRLWTGCRRNALRRIDVSRLEQASISERSLGILGRMVRLTEDSGVRAVLLSAPRKGAAANGRLAALHEYANENGLAFLDLNECFDEVGFDNETDFRDESHLNVLGAEKATRRIGTWLTEEVGVEVSGAGSKDVRWKDRCIAYDRARIAQLGRTCK